MELAELLERVKAATGPDRMLDGALHVHFSDGRLTEHDDFGWVKGPRDIGEAPRLTASLDAALALVERVRPGSWIELTGPRKYLNIPSPVPNYWRAECGAIGWGASPALALLAALLTAEVQQLAPADVGSAPLSEERSDA